MTFPSFYFETRFSVQLQGIDWPEAFAIVTACATTGEIWSHEASADATTRLLAAIRQANLWHCPVTGFSPAGSHHEPGWAIACSLEDACLLGQKFRQHAIYYVRGDELTVCLCENTFSEVTVGHFRERIVPRGDDGTLSRE
ncbi:MAG: DUF3293 domain-containing protein [Planctomycetota bacterium]